jgi:hypothetical protein
MDANFNIFEAPRRNEEMKNEPATQELQRTKETLRENKSSINLFSRAHNSEKKHL